jgi:membrane associated rhomboid family serine protease
LAVLILIHAVRMLAFTANFDFEVLLRFGFIPVRYDPSLVLGGTLPGGVGADFWTFLTYALLHADITHLGFNSVWLLAFGTPVARRFGAARFLFFMVVTAAAGAAAHLATHVGEFLPMIGASAAISGAMAAAARFAFQRGGPLRVRDNRAESFRVPAASLGAALRDSRILIFLAIWFGVNLIFGIGSISISGAEQAVAWQAHIGGFVSGLLLFGWFDPVPASPRAEEPRLGSDTMER